MKNIFLTAIIQIIASITFAQNNIGIGTNTPDASAMLDVSSTNKGLLPPRMTTAQRNAIASPAKGLLVYDTGLNALYHYNGTVWAAVGGVTSPFSLPYTGTISTPSVAFSVSNTGGGEAIAATKSGATNAAVHGRAEGSLGIGVKGTITQPTGYGVYGTNPTGTAVNGTVTGLGSALKGEATNPLAEALLVNGNLRLYGGNTNPTEGAVLTSINAQGSAFWIARPKVAFRLKGISFNRRLFYDNVASRVFFQQEDYDLGGNSEPTSDDGVAYTSGTFIAPVNGIYAFDYSFGIETSITPFTNAELNLIKIPAGSVEEIVDTNEFINSYEFSSENGIRWYPVTKLLLKGSAQLQLKANDMVFLRFEPTFSLTGTACAARYEEDVNFFSGRLVVPE